MRALIVAGLLLPALALAQAPMKFGYQGRLLKSDGSPESGVVQMGFALYDAPTGGNKLWSETQSVALSDGYYATLLGEATPVPEGVLDAGGVHLELSLGGTPLAPRHQVGSVPYAAVAGKARDVSGGNVDAASLKVGGKTVVDSSGKVEFAQLKGCGNDNEILKWAGGSWGCVADLSSVAVSAPLSGTGAPGSPIAMGAAAAGQDGYLKGSDWSAFNAKVGSVGGGAQITVGGSATAPTISLTGCSAAGTLLKWDGSQWTCDSASVSVGGPLTGTGAATSPITLPAATAGADGYLKKDDFAAFAAKLGKVTAQAPLAGEGTAASPVSLAAATAGADGYLKKEDFASFNAKLGKVTAQAPLSGEGTAASPLLMAKATASADGYLAAADFARFNKAVGLGATQQSPGASCKAILDGGGSVGNGYYWIDPNAGSADDAFLAWCDMTTDGGGWTLCFSYDNTSYDSYNWPSIAESRNKMLAKRWGDTMLFGSGTRQGNFCNLFEPVSAGQTKLRAEVVKVADSAVLMSGVFTVRKSGFFTQVHNASTGSYDCLIDSTGNQRLLYSNYTAPSATYNQVMLTNCPGGLGLENAHLDRNGTSAGSHGIDGALIFAANPTGADQTKELSLHVNWYGTRTSESLYVTTAQATQTKFGVSATWYPNRYGRVDASPGLSHCWDYCGYTNTVDNVFKQRMWIR